MTSHASNSFLKLPDLAWNRTNRSFSRSVNVGYKNLHPQPVLFNYLFLHLIFQISPRNHNCNALNVFLIVLSHNNARTENGQWILWPFSEPGPLGPRSASLGDTPKMQSKGEKREAPSPPEERIAKKGKGSTSASYSEATRSQIHKEVHLPQ